MGALPLHRWIGTQEGLVRFDGVEFKTYDKSQYPGLNNNFIWDIDEDNHGNLWLATAGGGVSCFDEFKFTYYDTSDGLANNYANTILAAKDGTIWIGTEDGLNRLKDGRPVPSNPALGRAGFYFVSIIFFVILCPLLSIWQK
ncbi:MAG: ligand-binding sensor domain-containing protein [Candidatus Zhuqueibacterota bacterium]